MKKLLLAALALLVPTLAIADARINGTNVINEPGLPYSNVYVFDLNALGVDRVAFQSNQSSATIPAVTYADGTKGTGQITVGSVSNLLAAPATNQITVTASANIPAVAATNRITVTSTTSIAGAKITLGGVGLFRTIVYTEGEDWFKAGTASGTAAALAVALAKSGYVATSNTAGSAVIYTTATKTGVGGNAYTLASSTGNITVLTANYAGGQDSAFNNAVLTLNGKKFREGYEWKAVATSSGTATAIATVLNRLSDIDASAAGSVVYATATVSGTAGNSFTLSSSTAALTAAGATFSGGRNVGTVAIGGKALTFGVDIATAATTTLQAAAIRTAILANAEISAAVDVSTAANVVYATATVVGSGGNYALAASPASSLSVSGSGSMAGGATNSIDISADKISVTNTFTTGLPVLLTTVAGTPPTGLSAGTTYYTMPTDGTAFKLASSQLNAIAGTAVDITAVTAAGGGSFTLTPLTITGTPSFKWQVGIDGTTWADLAVSSVTLASPYTATATMWDMGELNYRYLRLNVVGPTTGGLNLKVWMNGKN